MRSSRPGSARRPHAPHWRGWAPDPRPPADRDEERALASTSSHAPAGPEGLRPGAQIDRYLLLRDVRKRLGQRGMLHAFVALDLEGMDEVLLMAAPEHGALLPDAEREFRVARELHGTSLLSPLRAGEADEVLFLTYPWVPTLSLRELLRAGPLGEEQAARILWRVTEALGDLHGRSLVHGDLRPEMVRVTHEGKVYLTGWLPSVFRMAREVLGEKERPSQYWAPEVHAGNPSVPASDIYSLALLAYELYAGKSLLMTIRAKDAAERQRKLHGALQKGIQLGKAVPSRVEKLLRGWLDIDPAARPASATEVAAALESAMTGSRYKGEADAVLQAREVVPRLAERARLLRSAASRLEVGDALGGAVRVRTAVGLGVESASQEGMKVRELLADCLWNTFTSEGRGRELHTRAICVEVHRAARELGSESMAELSRRRLMEYADAVGPLAALLEPPSPESVAKERDRLLRRVSVDPFDDLALLGLAILMKDQVPEAATVVELRREVCAASGLPLAAAALGGRALAAAEETGPALERLHELVQAARQQLQGGGPAAHEQLAAMASETSSGIQEVPSGIRGVDSAVSDPPSGLREPPSGIHPAPDLGDAAAPSARGPALAAPGPAASLGADTSAPLEKARDALEVGDLDRAAAALTDLAAFGGGARERTHGEVVSLARRFLWLALMPGPAGSRRDHALEKLLGVLRAYDVHRLVPLCERLLVAAIPEGEEQARLAELLAAAPDSLEILQAASRVAAGAGDDAAWVRHLEEAGSRFLEMGEMALASRMYMAIRGIQPTSPIAMEGMQKVMALGEDIAGAGQKFQAIRQQVENAEFPGAALIPVKGFLALHPTYEPALEAAAHLYGLEDKHHEAAEIHLELGKRALMREEPAKARTHMRKVLENDLENDEALMYLATLEPPPYDAPKVAWKLRVFLLEREGLLRAAMHHARKQLTGEGTDFSILATLADLARKAGEDPSPHLALQGHLALEQGNYEAAGDCFRAAVQEAPNPNELIDELLHVDGVLRALPRHELESMRR